MLLAGAHDGAVLRVVATTRPDSLDALITPELSETIGEAVEFLAPLGTEGLLRAVTEPVAEVPGLWFEPGLPERIAADAGTEPGRMPLTQFALTRLWEGRDRSTLTHAAYDAMGGVAGALVGYADDVLDRLPEPRRLRARRLFVQLARPGEGDTFLRRPTRAADLAPELAELARELAAGRLVVLSPAPDGDGSDSGREEIVDLAHESLTRLWPRLRRWLADSREIRLWQEQLRADLRRWEARRREPARLLSGGDLAEADRKEAAAEDLTDDEREYIRLSRAHARRAIRRRGAASLALITLTVIAVLLSYLSLQNARRAQDDLRTQAAGALARAADDRPGGDPATALQLALAGWHARQTDATRQALLRQYVRARHLTGSHPGLWRGPVTGMHAAPDGRTLVVRSRPAEGGRSAYTVITGALDGRPRARELTGTGNSTAEDGAALSPDGRLFALATGGEIRLWRLDGPGRPTRLGIGDRKIPRSTRAHLDFSGDGKRLLLAAVDASRDCVGNRARCARAVAAAWHVPSGARLGLADGIVPSSGLEDAAFTSDPESVVTISRPPGGADRRVDIRDIATGRPSHTSDADAGVGTAIHRGGETLVRTDTATPRAQPLGRVPGAGIGLPRADGDPDATDGYQVEGTADSDERLEAGGYAELTLTDFRTARSYRTAVPTAGPAPAEYGNVAAVPGDDGALTVLAPVGTALMVARAEPAGAVTVPGDGLAVQRVSPDGKHLAVVTDQWLHIVDAARGRLRSVPLPAGRAASWTPTWTADSRRVVVWSRGTNLHRSFSAQEPGDGVPLGRLMPGAPEPGSTEAVSGKEVEAVAALEGGEIAVLTVEGGLARIDATTGRLLSPPRPVRPQPEWSGPGTENRAFRHGTLLARPGHPGQLAVITRAGTESGEILLLDAREPRLIATLSGPPVAGSGGHLGSSLAFDPNGSRLAVRHSDGSIRVRDVDRPKAPASGGAPGAGSDLLVGFGPGGGVITYQSSTRRIRIHDPAGDGTVDVLPLAGGEWGDGLVGGDRLTADTGQLRQTFELRPGTWFRTLCAAVGRDYTAAERKLLPPGAPSEPPCD